MKRLTILFALTLVCLSLVSCNKVAVNIDETYNQDNYIVSDQTEKAEETDVPLQTETETIEIIEKEKVPLSDLHVIDKNGLYYFSNDDITDTFGNKHHTYHSLKDGAYAIFYLNGKYSNFSGGLVMEEDEASDSYYTATFYADGKEIYTSEELEKTKGQINFSVDTRDCQQLRIEVAGCNGYRTYGLKIIDAEVRK